MKCRLIKTDELIVIHPEDWWCFFIYNELVSPYARLGTLEIDDMELLEEVGFETKGIKDTIKMEQVV